MRIVKMYSLSSALQCHLHVVNIRMYINEFSFVYALYAHMHTYAQVSMYMCHACKYECVMHACMCDCMHVCMYVCMSACMYVLNVCMHKFVCIYV